MQKQSRYDLQDQHLQELTRKLEQFEIRMQQAAQPTPTAPPPPPLPINPFLRDTGGEGDGQREMVAIGSLPSSAHMGGGPLAQMGGGALAQMGAGALERASGNDNPASRWLGVIRDSVIEGQFNELGPMTFPVTVTPQGKEWEALDWKVIKEAKLAVTQYGLKSPYTNSVIPHIFTAHLLTPFDVRMIVQILLTASQQLQVFQRWQVACDAAAATPHQQGDPLYEVQAQTLTGAGPFASSNWEVGFQPEALPLTEELALKTMKKQRQHLQE